MEPPYSGVEYSDPNRLGLQWLPQVAVSSVTKLQHTASRTLLTQTFVNSSTVSIPTAHYTFPLYESCAIVAFRCHVGSRLIEGIIQQKDDASATFQAAVDRNEPASLLEQHTPDVFSTSIGNVPARETVKVEIEYIMELKHDAEVDGLRFTIPTSIAPRYGALPTGLSKHSTNRAVTARNIFISVEVSMPGTIQSVESPSHSISLQLGGHSTNDPDDASSPHRALVTLSQATTELGRDFILLIKCTSLSSPAALLETHPTIPNSNALMVTLIPKFNLPIGTRPEVVFIVDRSGSMSSRVAPLKSSLSVFLKSLPVDVNFNICSFGSHHSFLWDRSRPYNNQTFTEAQDHCNRMQANFGGTEILPAIKSTIQRRLIGLNLEIMVLTDGEVWNSEVLFKYVEKETEKGDVRLFSLGIGRDVSHALIDGLARVGRGFSQVVSDEREGMESKVTRMLRGGLGAHIVNFRLEWEGKPSPEEVNLRSLSPITSRINILDSQANNDSPVSFSDAPHFTIRTVIQAPHKIQPLFPFSRSTAYVLVSSDAHIPSHVFLRGTTPEGDELEAKIAVQRVPVQGETIHQLAARKILQELKDGTSYVHGAVDKERQPALLAKWVEKEGVRVGLKYGVASHWTSFVAVERMEVVKEEKMEVVEEEDDEEDEERRDKRVVDVSPQNAPDDDEDSVMEAAFVSNDSNNYGMHRRGPPGSHFGQPVFGGGSSFPAMMMLATPPPHPKSISTRSNHTDFFRQKGRSSAPMSDYTDSVLSNDATFYSDQGSIPADSLDRSSVIGNSSIGKRREGESVKKPTKRSFWPSLKRSIPLRIDRSSSTWSSLSLPLGLNRPHLPAEYDNDVADIQLTGSRSYVPRFTQVVSGTLESTNPRLSSNRGGFISHARPTSMQSLTRLGLFADNSSSGFSSSASTTPFIPGSPPDPHNTLHPPQSTSPSRPNQVYVAHHDSQAPPVTIYHQEGTHIVELPPRYPASGDPGTVVSMDYAEEQSVFSRPPQASTTRSARSFTEEEETSHQHSTIFETSKAPPATPAVSFRSILRSRSRTAPSPKKREPEVWTGLRESVVLKFSGSDSSKNEPFNTSGIAYSLSSAPPPERFVADTGAQPMSSRTKSLIDLQTFEGYFVLDSALATLLGVSLSELEARLVTIVPVILGVGPKYKNLMWATILAIKLFETQLAGERSVWQLVVDKARVWITRVGFKEDISQFEKMAGEVLDA